jgi:hypothetical protein
MLNRIVEDCAISSSLETEREADGLFYERRIYRRHDRHAVSVVAYLPYDVRSCL